MWRPAMWGCRRVAGTISRHPWALLTLATIPIGLGIVIDGYAALATGGGALLVLLAAWGWCLAQRERHLLLAAAVNAKGLGRREIRDAIAGLFRHRGYTVRPHARFDFVLEKDGRRIAVRIAPGAARIDVGTVAAFERDFTARRLTHGYYLAPGGFAPDALAIEKDHAEQLCLIDGAKLSELFAKMRADLDGGDVPAVLPPPPCPVCGEAMLLRTPKKRRRFWGCSAWPLCNGRRELSPFDKASLEKVR